MSYRISHKPILLTIPLVLAAFTHLWNPVGFPDIFYDEGIYMSRAMHVLEGGGPQLGFFHDHPFFGQIFLASFLAITGYPNSLNPTADAHSIQALYLVPRILMGLLAILDTFLIYHITSRRFDGSIALLASILFAVMPITWLFRRILLDSILLPFLLSSILFALYSKDSASKKTVLLSGIFLGTAIFTKEVIVLMIPLVAYLIYQNNRNATSVGLWFIPVILIPIIWPLQAAETNQFHDWVNDILYQVHRQNYNFGQIVMQFLRFDPVLLILGIAGTAYAATKRDWTILLWVVPFVIFFAFVGYVQYFYWMPVLPPFCIASARLISELMKRFREKFQQASFLAVTTGLGIFGLSMCVLLVTTDVSSQFEAAAFVIHNVHNNGIPYDDNNTTIISSAVYSWIFKDVFHMSNVLPDYRSLLFHPVNTSKILLVADPHFMANIGTGPQLAAAYNNTVTVKRFDGGVLNYNTKQYPFTNMDSSYDGSKIEIRENR